MTARTLPDRVPTILGSRVVLRAWADGDVDVVVRAGTDPHITGTTSVTPHGTKGDALAFVVRQRGRLRDGFGYSFAIADTSTGEAVGMIGLWVRDLPDGRASIGYWVDPARRGRGYATDALTTLSEWALGHEEVHRLQLAVEPWNEGSWRAAQACGFAREGLMRSWQVARGERRDMYLYAKVR